MPVASQILFVSNHAEDAISGGHNARNAAALEALRKRYGVSYFGPVDPPVNGLRKTVSKARRMTGLRGKFFHYSQSRLQEIAQAYSVAATSDSAVEFFHGFTPWIATSPLRPYIAWNDCTFHDYIRIFHKASRFDQMDLDRIERQEAAWLANAERVIFRSEYFAQRAITHYGLPKSKVGSVSNFGGLEPPEADGYSGDQSFIFVSTNFEGKGGPQVIEAFDRVRRQHTNAELVIIGAAPTGYQFGLGVKYAGYLDKSDPEQLAQFRGYFENAVALIHPTSKDTNPAIIVEAAYFGCPSVTSNAFAIPEFVDNRVTGLLLENVRDTDEIAGHMIWMLEDADGYAKMRREARSRALSSFTRAAFERQLLAHVGDVVAA